MLFVFQTWNLLLVNECGIHEEVMVEMDFLLVALMI
jgi:hypothetical protein